MNIMDVYRKLIIVIEKKALSVCELNEFLKDNTINTWKLWKKSHTYKKCWYHNILKNNNEDQNTKLNVLFDKLEHEMTIKQNNDMNKKWRFFIHIYERIQNINNMLMEIWRIILSRKNK